MKRRKSSSTYRREKMILTASSVLVLAAMTVTGVYLYNGKQAMEPENNVVDFSALEKEEDGKNQITQVENNAARNLTSGQQDTGEMDYDPYYAEKDRLLNGQYEENSVPDGAGNALNQEGSMQAGETALLENENAGLASVGYVEMQRSENGVTAIYPQEEAGSADGVAEAAEEAAEDRDVAEAAADSAEADAMVAVADVAQEERELHFSQESGLAWPIVGNVLLNYSMDKTIFFPTLQQYKYNPSIVIAAAQGTNVACAADGIVTAVYDDAQTGTTVVMNLGNGYELTYGQLDEVSVEEGELVETGVFIGKVSAPTKYYTQEGTNVYFKLTRDGKPVNPLDYLE